MSRDRLSSSAMAEKWFSHPIFNSDLSLANSSSSLVDQQKQPLNEKKLKNKAAIQSSKKQSDDVDDDEVMPATCA